MDRLEELKQKYQPVLSTMQQKQVQLTHLHVQDNKLFIGGIAGSQDLKNDVWNSIKAVDPKYEDLIADISVDASRARRPPPPRLPLPPLPTGLPLSQLFSLIRSSQVIHSRKSVSSFTVTRISI